MVLHWFRKKAKTAISLKSYGVTHVTSLRRDEEQPTAGRPRHRHIAFLGVITDNVRKLNEHIKEMKKEGITKVGLENVILDSKDVGFNQSKRYFRAVVLRLRRAGITPVVIEDAIAFNMERRMERITAEDALFNRKTPSFFGEKKYGRFLTPELARLNKKDPEKLLYEFSDALIYFRSQQMVQNARKEGLKAIIVGSAHNNDITDPAVELIYVNPNSESWRAIRKRKKAYLRFEQIIRQMYPLFTYNEWDDGD